jgi:hypothetical protein
MGLKKNSYWQSRTTGETVKQFGQVQKRMKSKYRGNAEFGEIWDHKIQTARMTIKTMWVNGQGKAFPPFAIKGL